MSDSPSARLSILRRQTSKSSLISLPHLFPSPENRPWPAAMMLGHLKGLERPGDRAVEYAKGVKGLVEADSGLGDWQMKVIYRKVGTTRQRKDSNTSVASRYPSSLTSYNPSTLSTIPASRAVSGASQFPTRLDSTSATEITDHATLSYPISRAPEGLPYPQLVDRQLSASGSASAGSGMKSAGSSSSVKMLMTFGRRSNKRQGGGSPSYSQTPPSSAGIQQTPMKDDFGPVSSRISIESTRPSYVHSPSGNRGAVPSPRGPRERLATGTGKRTSMDILDRSLSGRPSANVA